MLTIVNGSMGYKHRCSIRVRRTGFYARVAGFHRAIPLPGNFHLVDNPLRCIPAAVAPRPTILTRVSCCLRSLSGATASPQHHVVAGHDQVAEDCTWLHASWVWSQVQDAFLKHPESHSGRSTTVIVAAVRPLRFVGDGVP